MEQVLQLISSIADGGGFKSFELNSSKSFLNRILILASLVKEEVIVENVSFSGDVFKMIESLKEIGLIIEKNNKTLIIKNSFPECEGEGELELHTGDGGTTNRFLLGMLALGKREYKVIPDSDFLQRPNDSLFKSLKKLKVKVELFSNYITVQGPLVSRSEIVVDSAKSTQFASAITLALWDRDCEVILKSCHSSGTYFELTQKLVADFLDGKRSFIAPVDFSSLGYFIAYGTSIKEVTIPGVLSVDSLQPDSRLIGLLKRKNISLNLGCFGLSVRPGSYSGFNQNCSDFPDLVPTIIFLASYAESKSLLTHIKVLKYKESNRLLECFKLMDLFEIKYSYDEQMDQLSIEPSKPTNVSREYHAPNDHRMIILASLFMIKNGGGKIYNSSHVSKSFPSFFRQLHS